MSERVALYRHFGASGECLYIGISKSPDHRLAVHRARSPWGKDIARMDLEWFADRRAAAIAERLAIKSDVPRFNKVNANQPEIAPIADEGSFGEFLAEILSYSNSIGMTPQNFLRTSMGFGWDYWDRWRDGTRSPTLRTMAKIRAHIAANPAEKIKAA